MLIVSIIQTPVVPMSVARLRNIGWLDNQVLS